MCVALLTALTAGAQHLRIGLKGGADITELSFKKDVFNAENRTGWFFGPTLKVTTFTGLGFDISALYNQRESDLDLYTSGDENGDAVRVNTLKTKQLIVPLNVRYSIGMSDVVNFFGYAGPQIAFRMGDRDQRLDRQGEESEIVWRLKGSNFSVNVGAGITFDHLQVSANYNVGVGRTGEVTVQDAVDAAVDGFKGHYKSWQISLTYFF